MSMSWTPRNRIALAAKSNMKWIQLVRVNSPDEAMVYLGGVGAFFQLQKIGLAKQRPYYPGLNIYNLWYFDSNTPVSPEFTPLFGSNRGPFYGQDYSGIKLQKGEFYPWTETYLMDWPKSWITGRFDALTLISTPQTLLTPSTNRTLFTAFLTMLAWWEDGNGTPVPQPIKNDGKKYRLNVAPAGLYWGYSCGPFVIKNAPLGSSVTVLPPWFPN